MKGPLLREAGLSVSADVGGLRGGAYNRGMSKYYNPQKTRNVFDPKSSEPFTVSRSGIDLFEQCPRCFYIDKRLGTARPPGFPFSLNSAVDALLKKEFDIHRAAGSVHPLMKEYNIDAVPYAHAE